MTALTAMKQALEALKPFYVPNSPLMVNLRAAIAELEQAQSFGYYDHFNDVLYTGPAAQQNAEDAARGGNKITPLYAAPPTPAIPAGWKLLGETRENGVVWFDQNPHAFPLGTQFYAVPQPPKE